ncbi:MAG: alpha-glucosidase [Amaricoccus sp.]|uniref:alpha-glucosidase n=1 Tax=Amaricoccus sp. TaxID=1872485 RepID=UPI003315F49D
MTVKRRELFSAGFAAIAASALPRNASAAGEPGGTEYRAGDFIVRHLAAGLQVLHTRGAGRVIWETAPGGDFIGAEAATASIKEVGSPEGTFDITDTVRAAYGNPTIESAAVDGSKVIIAGELTGDTGTVRYSLVFEALSPTHLGFGISVDDPEVNRIVLAVDSPKDEAIFGCGSQLTYFNQKGRLLPILVQEHGIGRGLPVITELVDILDYNSGGNPYHTSIPAPQIITSRRRSMFLENEQYSAFDMRAADRISIKVWAPEMVGRILYGETPLDLIEAYTEYAGRMRPLPDWVHQGAILGLMGGTDSVRGKLADARNAGVAVAGLWLQDWVGTRHTSAGTQLWWNWFLDEEYYPGWRQLVDEVNRDGGRVLLYVNPFLATEEGHDQLFLEAKAKGYLVRTADGSPYLIRNANFLVGMLDLSNPDTRVWIKGLMKTNMLGIGAAGWMNDFGEALPFDARLHDGADPAVWHNRYPTEWQRVNREVIEESGHGDDMLFFSRSGFTTSPGIATLFWLGDQLMSWDEYDGIKTALVGILSGGMSGFSMIHSDVGGYIELGVEIGGKQHPIINRTPELFKRWAELNAFTAVMRGMEGIRPEMSVQFNSTPDIIAHFARCTKIYKGLAAYRKHLVAEAAAKGTPLCRHLFLHYPDDNNTHDIRYQFMLGRDLMVAPVLNKGREVVDVYFPAGDGWIDLWTGAEVGGPARWSAMPAPIGKPAAYLRKGGEFNGEILAGLKAEGVLG